MLPLITNRLLGHTDNYIEANAVMPTAPPEVLAWQNCRQPPLCNETHARTKNAHASARTHAHNHNAFVRSCVRVCMCCVCACVCVCARARVLPTPMRIAFGVNPWRTRSHAHDNTGPRHRGRKHRKK